MEIGTLNDIVAAFVGGEQRGVARASEVPAFLGGGYAFLMMVYSDDATGSETFTFQYYNSSTDEVLDIAETLAWVVNLAEGSVDNAFMMILAGASVELEINFSNGWNWFSVNAIQEDMGINSAFSGLPAQANDYIKSQTSSATYYAGYGWYPGFDVSVTSMYLLNLVNSGTMIYEGVPADPAQTPISLSPGWNWIGYVPQASMSVTSAPISVSFAPR